MRYTRMVAILAVTVISASLGWAQQGESIYNSKCAICHGPAGEGKIGPSLKTTKLSEDDVVLLLSRRPKDAAQETGLQFGRRSD